MISGAVLPVPADVQAGVASAWDQIGRPGPTLDGAQRAAVVGAARGGAGEGLDPLVVEVAHKVAQRPHTISAVWVDRLATRGLPMATYVEVMGLVGRVVAIDTAVRGLGAAPLEPPPPVKGPPTGRLDDAARQRSAFVPVVGAASPPSVLSWLPDEADAMMDLHGALYLSEAQMAEVGITRHGLERMQMEVVAARTSLINDCFF